MYAAEANWLVGESGEWRVESGERLRTELTGSVTSNFRVPSASGGSSPPVTLHSPLSTLHSFRAQVKIRYRSRPAAATVEVLPAGRFHVRFDEPCHAVAPGQAAVCYDGDRVLGGGWIE